MIPFRQGGEQGPLRVPVAAAGFDARVPTGSEGFVQDLDGVGDAPSDVLR